MIELPDTSALRDEINQADIDNRAKLRATGWWHSIDLGDGLVTPGARTLEELQAAYASFGLPGDLRGQRVLDIGTRDGFFAFEAERHGAAVAAVDYWRFDTFFEAHQKLHSRVEFHEMSVYDVGRDTLGSFDIVFFLGVFYHLQHPLLALQRVCEVAEEIAIVESHVIDNVIPTTAPVMEFYEQDELGGQYDNWWGPNTDCLVRLIRSAGFVETDLLSSTTARAAIKARRRFTHMPTEGPPSMEITGVCNALTFAPAVPRRGRQAFLSVFAQGVPQTATRENVKILVGGYGTLPTYVGATGDTEETRGRFQINAPMPAGLSVGKAPVQVFCHEHSSTIVEVEVIEGSVW